MTVAVKESAKMVAITLDGSEAMVPAGSTILEAARMNGIYIPTLCFMEKLKPIGACRVCSVDVDGVANPVMSCTTLAIDGMKITTHNDSLQQYRKEMIQFILVNHPLDCPVCERSGECSLQDLTYEFGITSHIWATTPREKVPVVDWGLIQYDKNLCILCERCIKICREVQGVAAYKIDGSGFDSRINTVTGEKLDCDFCGQCIAVCPVGALSSGMYFSARSWEMERIETVCPHCAVGCSLHVNVKKGERLCKQAAIVRVTSDQAIGHNNGNLCARGRFGYEFMQSDELLTSPLIKQGHGHVVSDWDRAYKLVAETLAGYLSVHGKDAVAGIGSERATNEDNYLFQKFFRDCLGSGNIDTVTNMLSRDTAAGLYDHFDDFPMTISFREMKEGNLFVFIGAEGSNENPVAGNHIREAIIGHGAEVAVAYSKEVDFLPVPKLQLPYEYAGMHQFTVELLLGTVKSVNDEGAFPEGLELSDTWVAKLNSSAQAGTMDEEFKAKIRELVTLIRKQEKPVYIIGMEAQRHPQGTAIVQNIVNLAKITGGKIMLYREYCNSQGALDMGVAPNLLPGYRKETRPELKSDAGVLELIEQGKVKALIIADEDMLRRYPDRERLVKAMRNVEFVVVMDQFYTQTCLEADVILPTTTAAAKSGTFTNLEGRVQRLKQVITPPGQARSLSDIFCELAAKMGKEFPFKNSGDVTREIEKEVDIYGDMAGGFADYGKLRRAEPSLKWTDPSPMRQVDPGSFMLLPDHSLFTLGLYTDYCPSLRPLAGKPYADFHLHGKPFVWFNSGDAQRLGLSDGDMVTFKYNSTQREACVKTAPKIKKGTIRIPDENDLYPSVTLVYEGGEAACVNVEGLKG